MQPWSLQQNVDQGRARSIGSVGGGFCDAGAGEGGVME
jgi:hypothetical protein